MFVKGRIDAPLAGTYYEAPAPGDPPFVGVGQVVDVDEVVCIIESMKVFVEVRSECRARIDKVLCANESFVPKGIALFEISSVD